MPTSFITLLDQYRKRAYSQRDKGDRFERLMQAFLLTDPQYAYRFQKVWLWNEFPGKRDLGGSDTGIDLVALTVDGDYWAIQCKCYQDTAIINKPEVDSFLSTSSRHFKNEDLQTVGFAHRLWISTTNNWGPNATAAISNQNPPVSRISLSYLIEAPVDWEALDRNVHGEAARTAKKDIRPHQKAALVNTHEAFKTADRGKLIMACGTGKTFTSLRIAENETNGCGLVLFLVPSIALLGQTLREWSADALEPINAICICSDAQITKQRTKSEDFDGFSTVDLAAPASTDIRSIVQQFNNVKLLEKTGMTVVFSTYQSIEVIAAAQAKMLESGDYGVFDLIICDEAHRTTGVTLSNEDNSSFTKVHDNEFIKGKKRLYMTATPRLFHDDAKTRAKDADAVLCSMDDVTLYGEEIFRIGFGEAVENGLLTDYKVLILTMNEQDVPEAVQKSLAGSDHEISTDDTSKLIGCINALSKQVLGDAGIIKETDPNPMRRAVAFCQSIAVSGKISQTFNSATDVYRNTLTEKKKSEMVSVEARHVDGTMAAPYRDELLTWLKAGSTDHSECRVLTNVRCLSEGVDVPSLDAVMFLSARNSEVDVVQSVGRVMRKSPGKQYGYIIIPVVIPSNVDAARAMDDNDRYKVVWTVLNALRAHDDRFNAIVNKIDLNKTPPPQIVVGGPGGSFDEEESNTEQDGNASTSKEIQAAAGRQLSFEFEQLKGVFYAKLVEKVGDRIYWEKWAKDVAIIAERQIERITNLINKEGDHKTAFLKFLVGLQKNINPGITQNQAIEMLSQHIITKPVFDALFEGYSFVKNNPISKSMQTMMDLLDASSLEKESETLQKFYDSVKKRASGIDNADGKQRIIIELYDKFFKTAFPKMVEQLGIVYTPIEVVDFIIHSVNDILKKEFDRSISDENIHILDPFTGTGTFITRLLQSGLIKPGDLERKYKQEIHANEIVLLAYYIAAVNIENAFHDQLEDSERYESFDGIVLTDTFQLGESDDSEKMFSDMFPQNSKRVAAQKKAPLRVIIGNPPYSVGQKSANDNAQNQKYERLDKRIESTYAKGSKATSVKALYDSYIKAFRWSTDRLDVKNGGIIAFVSNGAWLDTNGMDGFRKSLEKEFSAIYVFNLRGNQRTSGELSRKEGGKIFGSGSRTPIAITFLVKNPKSTNDKAIVNYHDIGEYLTQVDKLKIIQKFKTVSNDKMPWKVLDPNEYGDWISQRNGVFDDFVPLNSDKKYDLNCTAYFITYSLGVASSRDSWVYNFSKLHLSENMISTINFYNQERVEYSKKRGQLLPGGDKHIISNDPSKISWNDSLRDLCAKNVQLEYNSNEIYKGLYRPFCKSHLYFVREFIQRPYQMPKLFPNNLLPNLLICISSVGSNKGLSVLLSNVVADLHFNGDSQCFPLYYYEETQRQAPSLFDGEGQSDFVRKDGVSDFILKRVRSQYGNMVNKEDIFYYVYGFLHSPTYCTIFEADLKKMLPKLPLVEKTEDFWAFSKAGRKLADLHINYETVAPADSITVKGDESGFFKVEKMRYPKKNQKNVIYYNSQITIENIPDKAYEYIVNGKSAIDWIMERYQVTTHKESGIKNDPNDWADEVGNPRYILDLLLSVIRVSVETVDIVNALPVLTFEESVAVDLDE